MRALIPVLWLFYNVHCTVAGESNIGIYGGTPINITDVPYMALLTVKGYTYRCGASIVHEQFLVTAAHCCKYPYNNPSTMRVTVGIDYVGEAESDYEVEKITKHPNYWSSRNGNDFDIGVIKLKEKLTFSEQVRPIEMADANMIPKPGDMLLTMGFGTTEDSDDYSDQLLKVNLPYVDRETCRQMYKHNDWSHISDRNICAGGESGKDACEGDSGGSLVYKDHLIGVVSWGKFNPSCGVVGYPGVFAYVPAMRDFVDNVIKND